MRAKAGQQAAQDLHDGREAAAFVAFAAAEREQRATLAKGVRVGGRLTVFVDDPAQRHLLAAR